jgi:hypothetical protein
VEVYPLLPQLPAGGPASTTAALPLLSAAALASPPANAPGGGGGSGGGGSPAAVSPAAAGSPRTPQPAGVPPPDHDPSIPAAAREEKLVALATGGKKRRERTREEQLMDNAAENALKLSTQLLYGYTGAHAVAVRDLSATPRLTERTEGNIFSRSSTGAIDIVPGPRPLGRIGHRLGYATNLSDLAAMLDGVPETEQLQVANRIVNDAVERGLVEPASLGLGTDVTAEEQALAMKKWFSMSRADRDSAEQKARLRDNELRAKQEEAERKRIQAGRVEGGESPTGSPKEGSPTGSPTAAAATSAAEDGDGGSPRAAVTAPAASHKGVAHPEGAHLGKTMTKRENAIARAAMKSVVDAVARVIDATPQEHQVELLAMLARAGGIGMEAMERPRVWTGLDTRVRFAAFAMSELMGGNTRKARAARVATNADKTLPTPLPQRAHAYILTHAPPAGAPHPTLSSEAIARLLLAHVNTGATSAAATVTTPCLLCHRLIELMPPPVDADLEDLRARQAALQEMGLELGADGKSVVAKAATNEEKAAGSSPRGGDSPRAGAGAGASEGEGGAQPGKKAEGRRAALAKKLSDAMQLTSRKAPSGLVGAAAAASGDRPLVAKGADDAYLRTVPAAPFAPFVRVALRASGHRAGGIASMTSAKLAQLAEKRAGDAYVAGCVDEVVARRDALLADEKRILEALAKEVGEEAADDGGVVKAMKLDNRASTMLAKLEADFGKEDELEDLAVTIIMAERSIAHMSAVAAERAEVAEARAVHGAGALSALAEGDEAEEEEEEEEEEEKEGVSIDGGSVAGSTAGCSDSGAPSARRRTRTQQSAHSGGEVERGRRVALSLWKKVSTAHGGGADASPTSPSSPKSPASCSPPPSGALRATSPLGGGGSVVGGGSSAGKGTALARDRHSASGGGSTVGGGGAASPAAPGAPGEPAKLSIVELARKSMEHQPTMEEMMKNAAVAEVVYKREAALAERMSMKRGAKYWQAVALHPHNREAKINALGMDKATILALQRAHAMKAHEKEARTAAEQLKKPPPPLRPMQKPHTQNTGFCGECDRYVRLALADHFGYKVAVLVLKGATVDVAGAEEVRRYAELARLEAQPLAKRRVPMEIATARQRAEFERTERAAAAARMGAAAQRSKEALEYAERADIAARRLDLKEPLSATARHVFLNDKWVECFDEETGRLFYYEVQSGRRQWARPPVQSFNLATGNYVPIELPKLFSLDIDGETQAHVAEMKRLDDAASRAVAAIRVVDNRRAGVLPAGLTGFAADLGPASAKVVPGSLRVTAPESAAHAQGARLAGERPAVSQTSHAAAAASRGPLSPAAHSARSLPLLPPSPSLTSPSARTLPLAPPSPALTSPSARTLPLAPPSPALTSPSARTLPAPVPLPTPALTGGGGAAPATPTRRLYERRSKRPEAPGGGQREAEAEPAPA